MHQEFQPVQVMVIAGGGSGGTQVGGGGGGGMVEGCRCHCYARWWHIR